MRLRLVMAMLSPSKSRASSRGKWDLNSRIVAVFIVRHYCVTSAPVSIKDISDIEGVEGGSPCLLTFREVGSWQYSAGGRSGSNFG